MSALRSALLLAGGAVLVACTFTRSLDYLTEGDRDAGSSSSSTSSSSSSSTSTTSSSGDPTVPSGTILAAAQADPTSLVQDADSLYWATSDNKVMKIAKAGGAAQELATIPNIAALAVDPTPTGSVFVLTDTNVKKLPKSGGAAVDFVAAPEATTIAADDASLFVLSSAEETLNVSLKRYAKDNTATVVELSPPDQTDAIALAIVGDAVLWSASNIDFAYVINEVPRAFQGPVPAPKVYLGGSAGIYVSAPTVFAADDMAFYWIETDLGFPYRLLRSTPNADGKELLNAKNDKLGAIAVDAEYIYLAESADARSRIVRIAKDGRVPDALGAQPNPSELVADATAVYVAFAGLGGTGATGGIQKIPTK